MLPMLEKMVARQLRMSSLSINFADITVGESHVRERYLSCKFLLCNPFLQMMRALFIFFSLFIQEIEKLKAREQPSQSRKQDISESGSSDNCVTHNLPLIYYCKTCKEPCCSDCCVLSGGTHHGHDLSRLCTVYDEHISQINDSVALLKIRNGELQHIVQRIDENIELINRSKDLQLREMARETHNMKERLEHDANKKLVILNDHKAALLKSINSCRLTVDTMQREIRRYPQSVLVRKSSEMVSSAMEVEKNASHTSIDRFDAITPDFVNELMPPFDQAELLIPNYTRRLQRMKQALEDTDSCDKMISQPDNDDEQVILSSPLQVGPLTWRLKVYPTGTGVSKNVYISVFVELTKGLNEPLPFEYRVEMVNAQDSNRNVSREFSSTFSQSESWGYNRFFRVADMEDGGFIDYERDDSVRFRFYVRSPTYYLKFIIQQRHVANLESTIAVLRDQMSSLSRENRVSSLSIFCIEDISNTDDETSPGRSSSSQRLEIHVPETIGNARCEPNNNDIDAEDHGREEVVTGEELLAEQDSV